MPCPRGRPLFPPLKVCAGADSPRLEGGRGSAGERRSPQTSLSPPGLAVGLLVAGWPLDQREEKPSPAFASGPGAGSSGGEVREAPGSRGGSPLPGSSDPGPVGVPCGCGRCCPPFLPPPPALGTGVCWEDPSSPGKWMHPALSPEVKSAARPGSSWGLGAGNPGGGGAGLPVSHRLGPSRQRAPPGPLRVCAQRLLGFSETLSLPTVPGAGPCRSPCRRHAQLCAAGS